MKGFYYIKNTINEQFSTPTAYFNTLDEAKEGIKYCADWYCSNGTGIIYFQTTEFAVGKYNRGKYIKQDGPKFICRGKGLDKDGNVIFSDKEY